MPRVHISRDRHRVLTCVCPIGDFGRAGFTNAPARPSPPNSPSSPHTRMRLQDLGPKLYACVKPLQPRMAAKITGMLLENDPEDVAALLVDAGELSRTVAEAARVSVWLAVYSAPPVRSCV